MKKVLFIVIFLCGCKIPKEINKLSLKLEIHTQNEYLDFIRGMNSQYTSIKVFGSEVMNLKTSLSLKDSFFSALILNKRLEELEIKGTTLTAVPEEIYELQSLKILDLGYNQISNLTQGMSKLKNLQYLNLTDNYFKDITNLIQELEHCTKLKSLLISHNQIKVIPIGICRITTLSYITLHNNVLETIPCCINKFRKLELYLENNPKLILPSCLRMYIYDEEQGSHNGLNIYF